MPSVDRKARVPTRTTAAAPGACWLMKSEPDVCSIHDLQRTRTTTWDGVRNYQARNFMRQMAVGDQVLFYHSNAEPSGVAGLATVSRTAFPDHTAFDPGSPYYDPKSTPQDPRWWMVEVRFVRAFAQTLPLATLREIPELADMWLFSRARLSVQPVESHHFALITALAG